MKVNELRIARITLYFMTHISRAVQQAVKARRSKTKKTRPFCKYYTRFGKLFKYRNMGRRTILRMHHRKWN